VFNRSPTIRPPQPPDTVEPTPAFSVSPNMLGIYGRPPDQGAGDVVMRRYEGPDTPSILRPDKSVDQRRRNTMLTDEGISVEEMKGAEFFDAARVSDKPKTPPYVPPPPEYWESLKKAPAKGKRR